MEKCENEERFSLQCVISIISGLRYEMVGKLLYSRLPFCDGCQRAASPERLGDIQKVPVEGAGMADGISTESRCHSGGCC